VKRFRFAPSPTGTLHIGNALSATANRGFGDWLLLRIDDTDPARNVPGGEEAIVADLRWLGVEWDEGPVRPVLACGAIPGGR
jgi:glutamyl/glutaminyl-tRNA synthetase